MDRRSFLQSTAGLAAFSMAGGLLTAAAHASGGLVALVHTQAAGDAGPVDSMIARLKQLSGEQGFEYRAVYAQDPATYETIFRTLADVGAAVIVSTFNEVAEPFKALAPSYPNTKWIQLFADPFEPAIPNVATVSYDYYLGCYLSGIFAARVSKTGKLGFIGGVSIPPINADFNAFKAGAQSVRPDATVSVAFAGSFQDPAKGQEIATQMYSSGIDYIQTDAAATDFGITAAANEAEGRLVSVLDPAQFPQGPKSVISIVGLDFGTSLYNEVTKALGSGWAGGTHEHTGLGTGVIDFIPSPLFAEQGAPDIVAKAKAVEPEIAAAKAAILDGSLKVPFNTTL
ncbi:BMP family ABC transporter substrate-binding protein [Pseudaminobacter soli (ex Li et al. 2025)]|uniref:BMP family ABC transporter substrate-binding protein n=1 Tax=Pseudaminobacter soli (ex Li et al. 2025) TaxID=1295366 RepID=A0A2P7S3U3_9HYPH|nr:BMP family ABC transporter substrate-binding protein [Mesorhizobium soli]